MYINYIILLIIFLKKYKPKTPSLRFKKDVFKFKSLFSYQSDFFFKVKNKSGRNDKGKVILKTRCKNYYNNITILNNNRNLKVNLGLVIKINFINKNSCFIGLIKYYDGSLSFIKLTGGLFIGNITQSIDPFFNKLLNNVTMLGCSINLCMLPKYAFFSNIIFNSKKRPVYGNSAGTYLTIYKFFNDTNIFLIKLPTGALKYVSGNSNILIGRNSNFLHKFSYIGKAGTNIKRGFKSNVRGVAMNPVDHPHGGRTKTNQPEMSPWGWVTKKNK